MPATTTAWTTVPVSSSASKTENGFSPGDADVQEQDAQRRSDWRRPRHPRESGDPSWLGKEWIPASAGTTKLRPSAIAQTSKSKTRSVAAIGNGRVIPAKAEIQCLWKRC